MRAFGLGAVLALCAAAAQACPMTLALYSDPQGGVELRFRAAQPWESGGSVSHVMELALPDGQVLWGRITGNMGTSRDEGHLYSGCPAPSPEGEPSEEELADCLAWEGVVYALQDAKIAPMPFADEKAPPALVLADLGRQLRYSVMTGGEEPVWDQLNLTGCAE
jgi:hypothetical protein